MRLIYFLHILCSSQRIGETLDIEIKRWAAGKEGNLRALLSTLQYVCSWQLLIYVLLFMIQQLSDYILETSKNAVVKVVASLCIRSKTRVAYVKIRF